MTVKMYGTQAEMLAMQRRKTAQQDKILIEDVRHPCYSVEIH